MTSVVRRALGVAVACRCPVLLWGVPGTGKTSAVTEMAAASEWPLEVVIASIREPSDFAGLPVVSNGSWTLRRHGGPHGWSMQGAGCCSSTRSQRRRLPSRRRFSGSCSNAMLATFGSRTRSPSSRPPMRPTRPPMGGTLRLRSRTGSVTSTGRSVRRSRQDGMIGGFDPVTIRSLDPVELARRTAHYDAVIGSFVRPPIGAAQPTAHRL